MVSTEVQLKICIEDGCFDFRHLFYPRCQLHLSQYRHARKAARRGPRRIPNSQRQCRLDNCTLSVWAKNLCRKHYKSHAVRTPCTFPRCTKSRHAQGLCFTHYEAMRRVGVLSVIQPQGVLTPQERFAQYVNITKTCHLWTGPKTTDGRGSFFLDGQPVRAYRAAFEFEFGPSPEDEEAKLLPLDHGCRIPACVKPDHLEPVTYQENMRRQHVAFGLADITQKDGWLFGLAIPEWQRGADNFPDDVVTKR